MTNEEAIAIIQTEAECVSRQQCDRDCGKCDLVMQAEDILEAYAKAIEVLKMQIPKKAIYSDYTDNELGAMIPTKAVCPVCGEEFEFGHWNDEDNHHCTCGQLMDWEE